MDDDLFQQFEFHTHGLLRDWQCTLKKDVDCQSVLVAGTAIARHVILLTATELNGKRIESDEWFEKAAAVLRFIATNPQIGYALCEAHFRHEPVVRDEHTGGPTQVSRLFEHAAATWHELVGKLSYCYAHNRVPGDSRRRRCRPDLEPPTIQTIDARLKSESTHARQLMAAQPSSDSCLGMPLSNSYQSVLNTFKKLRRVITSYVGDVLEIFGSLDGEWKCAEKENELRSRLATSEVLIFQLVADAQMALDSLPVAPRITGRVILGGGLFAESHAAALLAMGHGIIGVLNHEHTDGHVCSEYGVYYYDSGIFELSYKWMHHDNLRRIEIGMPFEFMLAAAEAATKSPISASATPPEATGTRPDHAVEMPGPVLRRDDPFRCFEFTEGGYKCRIASGIDMRQALLAGTRIAIDSVYTLSSLHYGCDDPEDAEHRPNVTKSRLFHKSELALSCLLEVDLIRNALCEAQIDESSCNGKSAIIDLLGIQSANYHAWVRAAMEFVMHVLVWPWTKDGPSCDVLVPRLEIESGRAIKLLATSSAISDNSMTASQRGDGTEALVWKIKRPDGSWSEVSKAELDAEFDRRPAHSKQEFENTINQPLIATAPTVYAVPPSEILVKVLSWLQAQAMDRTRHVFPSPTSKPTPVTAPYVRITHAEFTGYLLTIDAPVAPTIAECKKRRWITETALYANGWSHVGLYAVDLTIVSETVHRDELSPQNLPVTTTNAKTRIASITSPKSFDANPSKTDLQIVQEVVGAMSTRNPTVEALRDEVRKAGYSISNTRIGNAYRQLKAERGKK